MTFASVKIMISVSAALASLDMPTALPVRSSAAITVIRSGCACSISSVRSDDRST